MALKPVRRSRMAARHLLALLLTVLAAAPAGAANETPWLIPQPDHPTPWGLMDFDRTQGSAPPWERAHSLTGNWNGWRSYLEDEYGVYVLGSYTAEVAGNPVGGENQNVRYTQNVGLALLVDLERFAGLPSTRFIASASERTGESNSKKDIGNIYAVQQIYGGQTTRLVQLALGTQLFDSKLDVVAGRLNGLDDFAASPLYCNAQNLAFCGNPLSIPIDVNISSYPNTAWGARARWQPEPAFYLMTGVYNTRAGFRANKYHGVDFSIRHDSGAIVITELNVRPQHIGPHGLFTTLPGNYKFGGYWDTEPRLDFKTGLQERGTGGFYLAFDQMVWREPDSTDQGPTPWIAFHWAPPDKNPQTWFVNWGVVYRGMIPARDGDVAGVYGAYGYLSPDQRAVQRAAGHPGQVYEMILEANYRVPVLPWFYLQPDIQGVINPGGTGKIPNALVLALQFGVPF